MKTKRKNQQAITSKIDYTPKETVDRYPKFSRGQIPKNFQPISPVVSKSYIRPQETYGSVSTSGGIASKPVSPLKYTGTRCLGVTLLHKSNLVPVFSQEEAIDAATMRR